MEVKKKLIPRNKANARKWKHKEGGEINNKNLNKDEKPKKKLVIKR